jgi:phage-related protein (TIGR01555 family)
VPVPQKIYERVYAAERTANEAPALAMTKRTDVLKTDMAQALSNQAAFEQRMAQYVFNRDNYGVKTIDETEDMVRLDTSMSDLDNVIMTQYQIVAAAANVPSVKLLGTSPKGFNATGSYEEASYHEFLETLQETAMSPLLDRHHELLIKSEVLPEFSQYFEICVKWNELDAMTAEEQAIVNKHKAENGAMLVASGAIDGMDERKRIINDPDSGYNGLLDIDDDELQVIESEPSELNNE